MQGSKAKIARFGSVRNQDLAEDQCRTWQICLAGICTPWWAPPGQQVKRSLGAQAWQKWQSLWIKHRGGYEALGWSSECPKKLCRAATTANPKTSALVTGSSPQFPQAHPHCAQNLKISRFALPQNTTWCCWSQGRSTRGPKTSGNLLAGCHDSSAHGCYWARESPKSPGASSSRPPPVQNLPGCHRSSPLYTEFAVPKQGDFKAS